MVFHINNKIFRLKISHLKNIEKNNFNQKGTTLIEIFLVVAISSILLVASFPIYGNLQVSSQVNTLSRNIMQTVETAKFKSVSGYNNSAHGVYFESGRFTLYQGFSYSLRDSSYDRVVLVDDAITITTTLAGNDVNFSKFLGYANSSGSITLNHSATQEQARITVNSKGLAQLE